MKNLPTRHSNQIGEVQVKDYIDISDAVGVLISDNVNKDYVFELLSKYNLNIKIYKLIDKTLVEI